VKDKLNAKGKIKVKGSMVSKYVRISFVFQKGKIYLGCGGGWRVRGYGFCTWWGVKSQGIWFLHQKIDPWDIVHAQSPSSYQ
jgi:hypothetical protein